MIASSGQIKSGALNLNTLKNEPITEQKPADTGARNLMLMPNFSPPALSASLEKSLGDSIEKMLDPTYSKQTGELSSGERRAILALHTINARFLGGKEDSVIGKYIKEFIETSLPNERKRAGEMVDILKEVQQYNQRNWINRAKDALSSPFR